ncbi:MAG TPA: hypothetical protein VNJ54_04370 [Plantibacter sp.]|uniref:hypothetical protein n=1 Tax=Plantibacter sp. TaxID=1871045 RepID=UPI002C8AFAE1|nr:hypothetical protein [Plantibacter sp.]
MAIGARMVIHNARQAIADLIGSVLAVDPSLPFVPSKLTAGSAFIRPARGTPFVSFEQGSFTRPTLALAAVVVSGTADWQNAAEWLDSAVETIVLAALDGPELAGISSPLVVTEVAEPGLVDTSTGVFLAIEVRFAPIFLKELRK